MKHEKELKTLSIGVTSLKMSKTEVSSNRNNTPVEIPIPIFNNSKPNDRPKRF